MKKLFTILLLFGAFVAKAQTPDTAFISTYKFNAVKISHFKNDQFDTDSVTHIGFTNVCSDGFSHIQADIILCSDNGFQLRLIPIFISGSAFTTLRASFQSAGNFYPILTYFSNNYLITPSKTIIFK